MMAEYIDREAAFDAVFEQFCASSDETEAALNAAIEEIRAIPAADVRPVVRGKWVDHPRWKWIYAECSECEVVSDVKSNFCPNCGADMREPPKEGEA